jgi:hypothetical protein
LFVVEMVRIRHAADRDMAEIQGRGDGYEQGYEAGYEQGNREASDQADLT